MTILEDIRGDINRRMKSYKHSAHPSSDEVSIAWLITEIDRLQEDKHPEALERKKNMRDTGGGCSVCGTSPARNVTGTYWLCESCEEEKIDYTP